VSDRCSQLVEADCSHSIERECTVELFYCWPFLEGDLREPAIWD